MNLKRSLALALSVLMLLTMPVAFGADGVLPRISGSDRYATAVAVSQEGWESAVTVVLARGDHFADALAGVPLAYKLDAPILLTAKDSLPAVTKNEIARLNATKVVILGGTGAVSKAVADEIAGTGILVTRIAGDDRYETAALIADEIVEEGKVGTVVLANGLNFADALAAAPYAAANGFPILLTHPSALPEATEDKINELAPSKMIIVGGTSAISSDVMTAVSTRNPVRVFGKDRFATAIALANHFAPETTMMYVASGLDFPDAITGAALAAKKGTGLLLVGNTLSDDVKNFINEFGIFDATIFGGLKAVNSDVENAINAALIGATETGVAGWTMGYTTVSIGGKTATAHATSGFYKVTGVAPGTHKATFRHLGYATVEKDIKVVKDRLSVNIEELVGLNADNIQVQIVAVDGNGAPVNNAEVVLQVWNSKAKSYGGELYPGVTDENGMLVWGNPEQGEDEGNVFAFGDKVKVMIGIDPVVDSEANTITGAYHWVTREVNLATDAELNELDGFVLTPVKKMNISGQVTGFFGEPVEEGNTVTFVFKSDPNGIMGVGDSINASINAKGEFQFKDLTLPTDKYVIQFVPTNETAAIHAKPVSITEGTNLMHNIKLEKGYDVEFRLDTEEAGERFRNDGVTAAIYDGDLLLITLAAELQTGGEYFTITGDRFAAGNYTMKVAGDYIIAKSFTLGVSAAAANEAGLVKLAGRTYRAGVITVEVYDNAETPALLDAFIELIDANGKVVATSKVYTSSYSFGGLPHNAKYTVRASKGSWSTEIRPTEKLDEKVAVTVIANEEVKQTITLKPVPKYANVAGYVRTAGTYVPAAGAQVYFHALNVINPETSRPFATNYYGPEDGEWIAQVGDSGLYSITDLYPGTYRVVIRDPGNHEYNISTITLKAGDDLKANNYFLIPGGNATFKVKVTAGTDVQSDQQLIDAFGIEIITSGDAADPDSEYQLFENLSGGIYNVFLENVVGYKDVDQDFAVAKGKETKKEIKMVAMDDSYAVTFSVFGKENTDITDTTNILVYSGSTLVWDNSGTLATGETTSCALLPDGKYTVEYWAQDYLLDTQNFTVKGVALFVPVLQLDAWQ